MAYFQYEMKWHAHNGQTNVVTCKASQEWKARHYLQDTYRGQASVIFLRRVAKVTDDDMIVEVD